MMARTYPCIGLLLFLVWAVGAVEESDLSKCSMDSAAAASRRFAFALYEVASRVSGAKKNVIVSPLAVGMSLSMLSAGATGWSGTQIFRTLGQLKGMKPTKDSECLLQAYHKSRFNTQFIFEEENANNRTAQLRGATRLFGEQNLTFQEDFVRQTGLYGAEMTVVPFQSSPKTAERRINAWVQDQTKGNVRQIIRPKALEPDTVIALVCAIYFKATLATPFTNGTDGKFHLHNGRTRTATYMTSRAPLRHMISSTLQADLAEITYDSPDGSNIDASLVLILPHKGKSVQTIGSQIDNEIIQKLLGQNESDEVCIKIPKFRLAGAQSLKFFVKRLGVREIFNKRRARLFDAIVQEDGDSPKRVYVTNMEHESRFEIDETGPKGDSFVTLMDAAETPAAGIQDQKTTITYDRAFIFLLYDKFTDSIVFMGRLSDPTRNIV